MKKKNGLIKKIFIVFIIVILSICFLSCKKEQEEKEEVDSFGPTFNVGEIIVNLADIGQARYAKAEIVLEAQDEESFSEIETRSPQIRDIIIEIFSGRKAETILALEGRNSIKKEIINRVNNILEKGKVKEVYFITIVVQ